ncbi:glycosyl hydrolase [Maribellus maritimus]|uniref:glycosyl hydrolase n=1 Tax=Maribellus maritimus TaxID=2870838 RepID=UPI001EEA6416|nr:glycosyl hydrolase [Maribellus maritimus]MCG6190876.1 hypothetical protein [Maribellus maritimus]
MKKFLPVFSLIIILLSCGKENNKEPEKINSFRKMKKEFWNPSAGYRTAPLWVWNSKITKQDIDKTLEEYKNKGIGGVFIHPRYGLITEYLSEEWWELVEYSFEKAGELDLKIWIYDENSFPSGFAGGHVAAEMPESNSEGVRLKSLFMKVLELPENARVKHVFKKEANQWKEITEISSNEKGREGEYCVLILEDYGKSKWFGGYSYVDLLKPGVTEKFIEITMPGYEQTLGREFGKRVPGIFTDEPNTNTRSHGTIRYTPDLYEQFEKRRGYKLESHLMSLITETGDWKKVRHDYQSVILQLFIDRWSKPWYKYTEEKNLAWTGHYWEHGWPSPQEGPDNMAMYAWHQQPAIDMLFNAEELRPDQFGNVRNVKELSSVANQFGRHRTLSETYGAAGWELTFFDMKRLGDWEYVLGVNFMNQHLAYISLVGDRKHDFPQSFGTHSPYWGVYKYLADYFARLSVALSSGVQNNKIVVIEPTTTAWMYYNPQGENRELKEIKTKFEPFLDQLERWQVEYDLGCEDIINRHGEIDGNKFVINQAEYEIVVLPPGLENLDKSTFHLLQEFAKKGGEIIQLGNLQFVDGEKASFADLQKNENWKNEKSLNPSFFADLAKNENIQFEHPDSIAGKVFHQRRELKDGQLLFISNFDKDETAEVNLKMKGKGVVCLHTENGKTENYIFEREGGNVHFSATLPPAGSRLFFISKSGKKSPEPKEEREMELYDAGEMTIKPVTQNILNIDYVELTLDTFDAEPMYFYEAANKIWQHHGYPDNPWVSSSQFKTELVDADTFGTGSGFTACYPFTVDSAFSSKKIQLVVEQPWLYKILVNGKPVTELENKNWMDKDFCLFEIGNLIQVGRNEVVLTASPFSVYCELEPVYLLGDFAVFPTNNGWMLENSLELELGSWKNQGMPFYGQTIAYSKKVQLKLETDFLVELNAWEGTVAEILVDEGHQGILYKKPYKMKVTVPYGIHDIKVKITGSNKNTFGPHHNFSTPGLVTPGSFKTAPIIQPSGNEYDLLNYGLMEDFEIYKYAEKEIDY